MKSRGPEIRKKEFPDPERVNPEIPSLKTPDKDPIPPQYRYKQHVEGFFPTCLMLRKLKKCNQAVETFQYIHSDTVYKTE